MTSTITHRAAIIILGICLTIILATVVLSDALVINQVDAGQDEPTTQKAKDFALTYDAARNAVTKVTIDPRLNGSDNAIVKHDDAGRIIAGKESSVVVVIPADYEFTELIIRR